jgi:hypothetical protein
LREKRWIVPTGGHKNRIVREAAPDSPSPAAELGGFKIFTHIIDWITKITGHSKGENLTFVVKIVP